MRDLSPTAFCIQNFAHDFSILQQQNACEFIARVRCHHEQDGSGFNRDGQQVEFHLQAFPTCPLFHLAASSFRCLRDKMEKCSAHDGKMQPARNLGEATFPSYLRAFSIMPRARPCRSADGSTCTRLLRSTACSQTHATTTGRMFVASGKQWSCSRTCTPAAMEARRRPCLVWTHRAWRSTYTPQTMAYSAEQSLSCGA